MHTESGLYLRHGWLQPVLKSLPGVHSPPWSQEEGWEGETSKVNTRLLWARYVRLPQRRKMMQKKSNHRSAQNHVYAKPTVSTHPLCLNQCSVHLKCYSLISNSEKRHPLILIMFTQESARNKTHGQ